MNLLSDIITYVRRIIKSPSDAVISDALIIDYINRFWLMDMSARIQLFDLKTKYQFQTIPTVDRYNMPLYNSQTEPGGQTITPFPIYQGFMGPCYINGIEVAFQTQKNLFYNFYPNFVQQSYQVATGNNGTNYTFRLPILSAPSPQNPPFQAILRGHVDMAGVIATGNNQDPIFGTNLNTAIPTTSIESAFFITTQGINNAPVVIQDSGQFLTGNINYGLLMQSPSAPYGYTALTNPLSPINPYTTTSNTINYLTGECNVNFNQSIPSGVAITAQYYFFQTGLPRMLLYNNNTITLRAPPDRQYLVELDAYLTPAAFLTTNQAIPYAYMAEYIARGAARKILSDTNDVEQFNFYEPLFKEQETLVWKRSLRQVTSTRTATIYSGGLLGGNRSGLNNGGSN